MPKVMAVLHMDEEALHLHATVIPIVTGERRKAESEQGNSKCKYRKKATDTIQLYADDVFTCDKKNVSKQTALFCSRSLLYRTNIYL